MNGKILLIAFRGNISESVLNKYSNIDKLFIPSSKKGIARAVTFIKNNKPMYVIGLGQYSGIDKEKLRIETKCNKNFRNDVIKDMKNLKISTFLKPRKNSKLASGIGNSWCNLLSITIANMSNVKPSYGFIHIPKNFNVITAKLEIESICDNIVF